MSAAVAAELIELGCMDYQSAYARQLEAVERRKAAAGADTLFLVEHPHVITVGRAQQALGNVLAAGEVAVVAIERGGDVTYHGPGQLVAYPIIYLGEHERDLHRFLRNLEEAMIRTLGRYGLISGRKPGKTGVWIEDRKIASIGIACRRWVTFHGLALNVSTDLSYFQRINPCGFQADIMTSMARELRQLRQLGRDVPDMAEVSAYLADDLGHTLGRRFERSQTTPP